MRSPSANPKLYKYIGRNAGDYYFPRLDINSPLPDEVKSTLHYMAHLGLQALPTLKQLSFLNCLFQREAVRAMAIPRKLCYGIVAIA